jgi:hypothetical protein
MHIIALVLPLFAVIALGYVLKRTRFLGEDFPHHLNRLTYYVTLPVLLFLETAAIDPGRLSYWPAAAGYPLIVLLTASLAMLAARAVAARTRGAFLQTAFRANLAYLGLPIVSAAFGEDTLPIVAVVIAVGVVINTVLSVGVLRIFAVEHAERSFLQRVGDIARNPLIVSIVLGLAVAWLDLELPAILTDTLELAARMSLPSILLVIGFALSFTRIGRNIGPTALASAVKLVIMPAVAYAVMRGVFHAEGDLLKTVVVLSAMPTAVVSQSFAKAFQADEGFTASTVSFDTLVSMVTVPLLILLIG